MPAGMMHTRLAARVSPARVTRAPRGARRRAAPARAAADNRASARAVRDAVARAPVPKRLTAGDAAAASGAPLAAVDAELADLAAKAGGYLQVTGSGELVYTFPEDFERQLLDRDAGVAREAAVERALEFGERAVRVAFGASLLVSLLVVYTAIAVASQSGDRERREEGRGGGFGGYRGGFGFSPFDVWYYTTPGPAPERRNPEGMNFLEAIFSFVFGDPDPNRQLEAQSWRQVGAVLQAEGGAVVAEQVAPYLMEPPSRAVDEDSNEEFMLDVLAKFGGQPQFDEESGRIVYVFPAQQVTASLANIEAQQREAEGALYASAADSMDGRYGEDEWESSSAYLQERPVEFSQASGGQKFMVALLGAANLVGVGVLAAKLADPYVVRAVLSGVDGGAGILRLAGALLPFLTAYAVSFFAIPAIRNALNSARNAGIRERNAQRQSAALEARRGGGRLQAGLEAAKRLQSRTVLGAGDVAYRTDRSVEEQRLEERAFDAKLGERDWLQ